METNLNSLFQKLTAYLARYLESVLPSFFNDWWSEAVLNNLSFQQRRMVEQRRIESLKNKGVSPGK
jgi:hypothetical protein